MPDDLAALMASGDADFVRGAYRLILKRDADVGGEQNYCQLLKSGRTRASVLEALAQSPEARTAAADVPGLARMLKWQRIGRMPVIGPLASGLRRLLRPMPDIDPQAAFRSEVIDLQRATHDLSSQLLAVARDLQARQSGVERALARIDRRQSEARRPRG